MSKKTRQKARARANAALSNHDRAHSNSATAVTSSRSRASAAATISASVFGSSKKRGNHLILDSGDVSATEVSVVCKKHKKGNKCFASSHSSILGALPREQDDNGDSHGGKHMFIKASSAAFPHSRATFFCCQGQCYVLALSGSSKLFIKSFGTSLQRSNSLACQIAAAIVSLDSRIVHAM
jgi:hypothetical protein